MRTWRWEHRCVESVLSSPFHGSQGAIHRKCFCQLGLLISWELLWLSWEAERVGQGNILLCTPLWHWSSTQGTYMLCKHSAILVHLWPVLITVSIWPASQPKKVETSLGPQHPVHLFTTVARSVLVMQSSFPWVWWASFIWTQCSEHSLVRTHTGLVLQPPT